MKANREATVRNNGNERERERDSFLANNAYLSKIPDDVTQLPLVGNSVLISPRD